MNFSSKIEKKRLGVPLAFFLIFVENFLFEFPGYYDWNLSKDTKF